MNFFLKKSILGHFSMRGKLLESLWRFKIDFLIYIPLKKGFERENLNFGDFNEKVNFWGHLMAEIPLVGYSGRPSSPYF